MKYEKRLRYPVVTQPFFIHLSFYIPTYIQLVKPKEAAMAVRSERAILITVFQVSRFMGYIF